MLCFCRRIFGIMIPLLIFCLQPSYATELGINYDPVHSIDFSHAVGLDNKQGMVDAIKRDLDKLHELRTRNNGQIFCNFAIENIFYPIF